MEDETPKSETGVQTDNRPWLYKKGQSGNPAGRPKGISLKEYAKMKFAHMTDEEREEYFRGLPKDMIWRMGEGNPETKSEVKQETTVLPILVKFIDEKSGSNGNTQ